jgi:hypothetical protein
MAKTEVTPLIGNTGYIDVAKEQFSKEIEEATAIEITHMVDDRLSTEVEEITMLIEDLKEELLTRKFKATEESQYSSQIFRKIRAMKEIAEMADEAYLEKIQDEELAEIEEYNTGFNVRQCGFSQTSSMGEEEIEEIAENYYGRRHMV